MIDEDARAAAKWLSAVAQLTSGAHFDARAVYAGACAHDGARRWAMVGGRRRADARARQKAWPMRASRRRAPSC